LFICPSSYYRPTGHYARKKHRKTECNLANGLQKLHAFIKFLNSKSATAANLEKKKTVSNLANLEKKKTVSNSKFGN